MIVEMYHLVEMLLFHFTATGLLYVIYMCEQQNTERNVSKQAKIWNNVTKGCNEDVQVLQYI